jgi:hypothetical protein
MNRFARGTTLLSALGFLALTGASQADEEKIAVKDLPRAVLKAVKSKFPGAEIKEAAEEEDDEGETTYEVSLKFKGHSYDVALEADGEIVEIEKEIDPEDLPSAVKKALAARHPKAEIEKAEVVAKEGKPPYYEVVIKSELAFTAKGKLVEAAEDEDEGHEEKASVKGKKSKEKKEDEDEEEREKSHSKVKKSKKAAKAEAEEDEDEEEHEKSHSKVKKSKKGEKGEAEDEDDDDDHKKSSKAKKAKHVDKDDDDDDQTD